MKFRSVRSKSPPVSFRDAIFQGLAPDGGLYIPDHIPMVDRSFLSGLNSWPLHEIAHRVVSHYVDEITSAELQRVIQSALNFPIPFVLLEEGIFLLELFHGPTLAFKDVGARWMAEMVSHFIQEQKGRVTVVVATSGDTGSAVAHGFFNVPNISVYILYPSGKISRLQEQQMATLGGNIHAVEVEGTFDDCQRLVKESFADRQILTTHTLTTANSINIGRLLPQVFYYFWAIAQLRRGYPNEAKQPMFIVPSGNLGNLTAAVYAKWMGAPMGTLVAATNANDVMAQYLSSGEFAPRSSIQTVSNAMDVGNPSNLARIRALYGNDLDRIRSDIAAMTITDDETLAQIGETYRRTGYVLDPHSAVGVAVARRMQNQKGGTSAMVVLATAHPAKFPELVEKATGVKVPVPSSLQKAMERPKHSTRIRAQFADWKALLLSTKTD